MEIENARPYFFGDIGCWSERTEVHKAAALGQTSQLARLIKSGASVNVVAVDSITPLHEACLRGQAQCVRLLLDAGAQVDARNVDGSTPLCDACSAGSLECVRLLLDHGAKADPALTSRTASPLHEACMGGNSDCVKLLIATGACLEAYDLYYGTPLHAACANKHTECVKELLNAGAKVNAARLHETPLHHAAKNMRVEMVEMLVEFGANVYARDQHNKRPVDFTTPGSPPATCLQFYETNPMNLQQLSRLAVRTMLGTRALKVIGQLDIPKLIIGYLCYDDPERTNHTLALQGLSCSLKATVVLQHARRAGGAGMEKTVADVSAPLPRSPHGNTFSHFPGPL